MADIYYKNLLPGQWQIDNLVMGRGTNIIVNSVDVKPYDINAPDYQTARNDEKKFGSDDFSPTTIEMQMAVLHNRLLPGWTGAIPNFWHSQPQLSDLARSWRFDEGRKIWGEMKPLFHRSKLDDKAKIIFGRPRQFAYTFDDTFNQGEVVNVQAEFQRADTFSYSVQEKIFVMNQLNSQVVINGTGGDAPSWVKLLIKGPINRPVVTMTNMWQQDTPLVVDFNYNIPAGMIVEINGNPWTRRVINNGNPPLSMGEYLVGDSPYLDKLRFDFNAVVQASVVGGNTNSDTSIAVTFRDAFQVI